MTASLISEQCRDGAAGEPSPEQSSPNLGAAGGAPGRYVVVIGNDEARRVCGFLQSRGTSCAT
ncbi:hypothetical protein [Streptomyces benahoarensis]|uniref:Uncharacterized protein n=1 Tax=Streptomyces benahoarensis TaxID=2595054 RepID=A0A553ZPV9_9ACTN|nr:hypothetical protein [Streptomyces benahoarensis]TSB31559.1 hypothetical protein FNJ62_05670 [Streptomyces benahoarensis]TSB43487.1 hypothetical protein FNZ23_04170 [Streptomyces benahoarensis]